MVWESLESTQQYIYIFILPYRYQLWKGVFNIRTFQLNKYDIDIFIVLLKDKKAVTFLCLLTRQQAIINNNRFHSLS